MPKQTYQPKKKKRAGTHGFLSRCGKSSGRKIIRNRRRSGRTRLSA
ncbi:MAG: 50S ribosomal protein L34 [Candidatus Kaiserbacteria bacterium]|nr:50S ribosomal protein L34 [Candidatus Kaiserbacteria bacterium]